MEHLRPYRSNNTTGFKVAPGDTVKIQPEGTIISQEDNLPITGQTFYRVELISVNLRDRAMVMIKTTNYWDNRPERECTTITESKQYFDTKLPFKRELYDQEGEIKWDPVEKQLSFTRYSWSK